MKISKQKAELAVQLLFEKTRDLANHRQKAAETFGINSFVVKSYNEFLNHIRKDVISKADLDDEYFEYVFGHEPRRP
ncbi:MAG: hypothetical protein IJH07_02865 [Ruminococcus sp.]|nr:hypothetical protein [Ruminococcus sp.]